MGNSTRTKRKAQHQVRSSKHQHVWQPSQKHGMTTRLGRRVSVYNASLQTTELLENILSHLDPQSMIAARGVCKTWNSVITTSPILQRFLYSRAEVSKMTWILDHGTDALRPYFFDREESKHDAEWLARQGACVPARLNTTFLTRDPACAAGLVDVRHRFGSAEGLKFNANIKSFYAANAVKHTYLTQPPAKEIVIYVAHRTRQPRKAWIPTDDEQTRISIKVASGVKWSDLLNGMRRGLARRNKGKRVSHRLWIDIELSRVWVIGSVFYNLAEYDAIMSGKEAGDVVGASRMLPLSRPQSKMSFSFP